MAARKPKVEVPAAPVDPLVEREQLAAATVESVREACESMSDTSMVHHQVKGLAALCDLVENDPAASDAVKDVRGVCVNSGRDAFRGVYVGTLKILREAYLRLSAPAGEPTPVDSPV